MFHMVLKAGVQRAGEQASELGFMKSEAGHNTNIYN